MSKQELVELVATKAGLTKADAARALDATLEGIKTGLKKQGKVTLVGFLISLCVELIQLPFASRASDIDDVILNTLGVIIGYIIYRIIKQTKSS